jgi:hypothetical protein
VPQALTVLRGSGPLGRDHQQPKHPDTAHQESSVAHQLQHPPTITQPTIKRPSFYPQGTELLPAPSLSRYSLILQPETALELQVLLLFSSPPSYLTIANVLLIRLYPHIFETVPPDSKLPRDHARRRPQLFRILCSKQTIMVLAHS